MRTPIRLTCLLAAALLLAAAPAFAESAKDIIQTAMKKYEERLANVETLSIVQTAMGVEITTEMEKQVVDGRAILVPTGEGTPGADPGTFFAEMEEVAASAKVKGKEKVDGVECWVIELNDMSAFDQEPQAGGSDFEAERGTFWIDRKDYLMRQMTMEGQADNQGQKMPITMNMTMRDYRDHEGFLWPFATDMAVTGLQAGMSAEDLEQARESLAEMKAQMAEMPEDQRKMMESMMGGQMAKLEEMVESGEMTMTIQVLSLTLNGG